MRILSVPDFFQLFQNIIKCLKIIHLSKLHFTIERANLNNIMLLIASHGYFHLLGKIAAEMDGFYIDKFANQASETPLFIAARCGYKKTFSLMQSGNWFHATQLENFYPLMYSDPFHNLALFGHTQYLIEVYNGICETMLDDINGSVPDLPDACADVIYGRSFAASYPLMKESYAPNDNTSLIDYVKSEDNLFASYPLMKESYAPNDNTSLIDYVKGEDNLGWSALHWAACLGNLALLKEAASLIADVNTPAENMTALHFACIKNHPECMKYLLTQGATLVVITEIMYCNHPLQMAAYHGSTEVLQILLSHMQENPAANADINYIDGNNETALHIACRENRSHCVKLLVDAGIDTTLVNEEGKTAETIAQEEKNTECLEILTAQNSLKQLFNENR